VKSYQSVRFRLLAASKGVATVEVYLLRDGMEDYHVSTHVFSDGEGFKIVGDEGFGFPAIDATWGVAKRRA